MNKLNDIDSKFNLLFSKKNYLIMIVGIVVILLGFLLMTGPDANTRPDGVLDPNYWNEDIYSWRRTRLAPFLILLGFGIEIFAILYNPDKGEKK
ncbi:MAG: DUF3098 domain-containing protein [Weeksellaceae bacterium]|jgi:hypothetical protein|nr:DUF3098 domain-containing protein [Weeksellaceae bacterium]